MKKAQRRSGFLCRRLLLFLSLALPYVMQAGPVKQAYTCKRYSIHDGLPQMQVTHLMQDMEGNLWASHWNGISRFNGLNFKTFTKTDGLHNNSSYHAIEYMRDSIAVIHPWGVSLGGESGFRSIPFPPDIVGVRNTSIYYAGGVFLIYNLKEYFTGEYAHLLFNPENQSFLFVKSLRSTLIHQVTVREQLPLRLSILTPEACYEVDTKGEALSGMKWQRVYDEMAAISPKAYFGFNRSKQKVFRITLTDNAIVETPTDIQIPNLARIKDYYVFAVTNGERIVYYDKDFNLFFADGKNIEPIGRKFGLIRNFLTDRDGNFWVATEEGIFNFYNFSFRTTKLFPEDFSDLIWSVAQDNNGAMMFGTVGRGLYEVQGNSFQKVNLSRFLPGSKSVNKEKSYMGSAKDSRGNLYIPFAHAFLRKDARGAYTMREVKGNPQGMVKDRHSDTIFAAHKGGILFIYPDGSHREVGTEAGFEPYQNEAIARDRFGKYWVSGSNNSYIQLYDGHEVTKWQGKLCGNVTSMAADHKGNIWMGNHEGLFLYDHEKEMRFAPKEINCPVYVIIPYADSLLCVGTPQELYVIHLKQFYETRTQRVKRYGTGNGFTAEGCIQNSYCIDKEGAVWMLGTNYCYNFHPQKISGSAVVHRPVFSEIAFSDTQERWKYISKADSLATQTLSYHESNLRFTFLSISYNFLNIRYRYRLNGFDKQWIDAGANRMVSYQNLPAGNYCFEVQASADGERWTASARTPSIYIAPAFWQRKAFYLVYAAGLFLLVYLAFIIARNKTRKKMETEKSLQSLRLRALKGKSSPHFSGNLLNAVDYMIRSGRYNEASKYIALFSRFSFSSLKDSESLLSTLESELSKISMYLELEKVRFADKLTYRIVTGKEVNPQTPILALALHTYCENAIKHGLFHKSGNWLITIHCFCRNTRIIVSVTDNGIGREAARRQHTQGSGEGLSIIASLIEIYNKTGKDMIEQEIIDLYDEQGTPAGTRVELRIPASFGHHI